MRSDVFVLEVDLQARPGRDGPLDDGAETHLCAGDAVVQNGTRHAWRNHGKEVARLAFFIVGAHHARFPGMKSPSRPSGGNDGA